MTNNVTGESMNITENAGPVDETSAVESTSLQMGDEVCFNITEEGTVIIGKPVAGVGQAIEADANQKYVFNMSSDDIVSAQTQGDDLVVTFDNGSTVTLENYTREFAGNETSLNFINGEVVTLASLLDEGQEPSVEELEEPQVNLREAAIEEESQTPDAVVEQLAQTEPAAGQESVADTLANIEPAAGEAGTGAAGNSGYGYESTFSAQGVIPLDDVGPIDPTALEYGIERPSDDLFIEEDAPEGPGPLNPEAEFNNVQVLEDGSVQLLINAVPVTDAGILTFTITGIPAGWAVTVTEGTFDAATGTWTHTTASGTPYSGGPVLSPPADSDVDLLSLPITVREEDPATERVGTVSGNIDVIVDAVADDPDVDGLDDTGLEGATLDIEIPTALTGEEVNNGGIGTDDGSESIVNIIISPVDPAVDLNDYIITNVNGPVTLDSNGNIVFADRGDLVDLQITPKDPKFVGSIDLDITLNTRDNASDVDFNTTNDTAQDNDVITLTWKPVAKPPEVEVEPRDANPNGDVDNGYVYEDNSVIMDVTGTLDANGSGNEILTLTVTGIDLSVLQGGANGFVPSNGPDGEVWTRVDAGGQFATDASYTITLNNGGANYVGSFTFTPDAQSDLDLTGMSAVASAYEPATNTSADSAPDSFDVYVDAVADPLDLKVEDSGGVENTALDIKISNVFTGEQLIENNGGDVNDGSESIVNIILSSAADLQADFIVTNDNNNITFDSNGNIVFTDKSDLNGLQIKPVDTNYAGTIEVTVTLNTAETQLNGVDFDATNNTATDSEVIRLSWDPTINPPSIVVNNGVDDALVKEDFSVDVPVFAKLGANASDTETLTIRIDGINLERLEGGENGFGATGQNGQNWTRVDDGSDNTNASYEIVLPAGVKEYNGVLSFDPLDQSDLDISGMIATAIANDTVTTSEGVLQVSDSATDSFNVIVDAVADKPDVTAADNSGEEGAALSVDINGMLGVDNFDGSESITGYEVRGNQTQMNDFIFKVNGVERAPVNGVVSLAPAEVDALVVTPRDDSFVGDLKLDAVILTADKPNDQEYDASDNTNSDRDPFTLTWIDDDEPILADPDPVSVDETNFFVAPNGQDSAGNTIEVSFGDDANGATIVGNGAFGNPQNITSNGDTISVSFDAATNTYTGTAGGRDVFTLQINAPSFEANGDAKSTYTFTLLDTVDHPVDGPSAADHNDDIPFTFGFTATDSDGDMKDGTITVNVLDDGPVAHDDVNDFAATQVNQDYNIVLVLDVSGSMAGNKIDLLKSSVSNLLQDFNNYNAGDVKVHIVPFSTSNQASASFSVTSDSELNAAIDFINGMNANGFTNYEAPMQSAINWLQGGNGSDQPIAGAETYTYFVSDGEPNRYVNNSGGTSSGSADLVMAEIDGNTATDTVSEINLLQSLSTEVIGVGIGVNATTLGRLGQIDSDGTALDVQDPNDLDAALQSTNPLNGTTSGNVITGQNGGAGAADILSADQDTTLTHIQFGSDVESLSGTGTATIDGAYGTLMINADGSYTYKLTATSTTADALQEVFKYTITDGDGDTAFANLTINITIPDDQPVILSTTDLSVDETDFTIPTMDQDSDSGQVDADFGNDGPGTYLVGNANDVTFTGAKNGALTSNGTPIEITVEGNSYVGKAAGETIFTLELNENNGHYNFTLLGQMDHADATNPDDVITMKFDVNVKDADNDSAAGKITVKVFDDAPVAHDDINAYQIEEIGKDFNIALILDVSGSMAGEQIALLKSSVSNLLQDYNDYKGGSVKVHIVPFATSDQASATFNVSSDAELNAAINFINGMNASGFTNYEAPMQSAIDWLQGNTANSPIAGAETYTYFVSDGEPNRYVNNSGGTSSGSADLVMAEIDGNTATDTVSEIDLLQSLSTEVVGVGIGVNATTLGRLGQIDSDGTALDVQDANDLYASLSAINPVQGSADGNVLSGENGGSNAADTLSQDADTLVTDVDGHAVLVGSSTVVDGTYGTLTIAANGEYSYTLKPGLSTVTGGTSARLNPAASDAYGNQTSITNNGITVAIANVGDYDISWVDTADGSGLGIASPSGSDKIYPKGETFDISFDQDASSVILTISELGSNNNNGEYGLDYTVHFADGTSQIGEFQFDPAIIVNGYADFELSSDDFGGKLIESVSINSTDAGFYDGASMLLADVQVTYPGSVEDIVDTFTYTITDADGDTSTATLTLYGDQYGTTIGNDNLYGNDNDNVIYGDAGDDVIVGNGGNDTLIGGQGADTFVFTENGGQDTVTDFDLSEGDALDIGDVLTGYDSLADSLSDFVFTASSGADTAVYVDAAGGGDQAAATLLVTLEGVDVTLDDLTGASKGGIIV